MPRGTNPGPGVSPTILAHGAATPTFSLGTPRGPRLASCRTFHRVSSMRATDADAAHPLAARNAARTRTVFSSLPRDPVSSLPVAAGHIGVWPIISPDVRTTALRRKGNSTGLHSPPKAGLRTRRGLRTSPCTARTRMPMTPRERGARAALSSRPARFHSLLDATPRRRSTCAGRAFWPCPMLAAPAAMSGDTAKTAAWPSAWGATFATLNPPYIGFPCGLRGRLVPLSYPGISQRRQYGADRRAGGHARQPGPRWKRRRVSLAQCRLVR